LISCTWNTSDVYDGGDAQARASARGCTERAQPGGAERRDAIIKELVGGNGG
jgi:hypothetical protein